MSYQKIIIWGPNQFNNRLFARQVTKLTGEIPICVNNEKELNKIMLDSNCAVFCDCDQKEAKAYCSRLARNYGFNGRAPSIVLLNVDKDQDLVDEVACYSIRGIFYSSDDYDNFSKG